MPQARAEGACYLRGPWALGPRCAAGCAKRNLRLSPAARDSNLACVGSAGRGRRLFEPPVPFRARARTRAAHRLCVNPTEGLCGSHTGACVATTQGPVGPPHRACGATTQARTGFGEHSGRSSKIEVFGRFLSLKTVIFSGQSAKTENLFEKNAHCRTAGPGPARAGPGQVTGNR